MKTKADPLIVPLKTTISHHNKRRKAGAKTWGIGELSGGVGNCIEKIELGRTHKN